MKLPTRRLSPCERNRLQYMAGGNLAANMCQGDLARLERHKDLFPIFKSPLLDENYNLPTWYGR